MKHFQIITRPLPWIVNRKRENKSSPERKLELENIHIFPPLNGRYFLLAVKSGMFIELSAEAYKEIESITSSGDFSSIPKEMDAELDVLMKMGVFEEAPRDNEGINYIKSLNLNVCHRCNIQCSYCFADGGLYGEAAAAMSPEIAKRSIDELLEQLPPDRQANVVFFGGEPLLVKDIVFETIRYGRKAAKGRPKGIMFDIFTNGTLIDQELGQLLRDDPDIRILLSLDGPPELNDRQRKGCGERGVASTVQEKLALLDGVSRQRFLVRSTVATTNPMIIDRAEYFSKLGFTNMVFDPAFCIDVEGIPEAAQIYDALTKELPAISAYMIKQVMKKNRISINLLSEPLSQILMNNPGAETSYVPKCPAGRNYIAIDANGNLYPCHYFVGNKDYILAHIKRDGLITRDMVVDNGSKDLSKNKQPTCNDCWLKNLCEGPCPYKRLVLYPGGMEAQNAYCRFMKKRIQISLSLLSSFYRMENYPYNNEWKKLENEIRE